MTKGPSGYTPNASYQLQQYTAAPRYTDPYVAGQEQERGAALGMAVDAMVSSIQKKNSQNLRL